MQVGLDPVRERSERKGPPPMNEICSWIGASGTFYTYYVRPRGAKLAPNQLGNYIYAKKDSAGQWTPVYIGQGDLTAHSAGQQLEARGATTCAHASHFHRRGPSR